jgi:hypothetical protein
MRRRQEVNMKRLVLPLLLAVALAAFAQDPQAWLGNLPQAKAYVQRRSSRYLRSGANADARLEKP